MTSIYVTLREYRCGLSSYGCTIVCVDVKLEGDVGDLQKNEYVSYDESLDYQL